MSKQMTDIEIAQNLKLEPILDIANKMGLGAEHIESYGLYKAKIALQALENKAETGKLVLVTAISPTPAGEGKTTTTVGLADALQQIGEKAIVALREPSLGPVFGMKGGAAGGGYAQVVPMEDINLHFTGDMHAITAANNILAALLDNHLQQGNSLKIDQKRVLWRRAMDINDRQLRHIIDGLGGKMQGVPREDGFEITVASEIMAILCLADSLADLKARLSRIVVAYNQDNEMITAQDLKAVGAMAVLLKDAIKPNLVQTLEGTPAFIHGGPFANIAHGCNSVLATKMALSYGDYTITEAGFGADLGAEKFLDIKCRNKEINPAAVVLVATIRALKYHGGQNKEDLTNENISALEKGLPNLWRHAENIKNVYHLPVVIAINRFSVDSLEEINYLKDACTKKGLDIFLTEVWSKGGKGALDLAKHVVKLCQQPVKFTYAYDLEASIFHKIDQINKKIYHGAKTIMSQQAENQAEELEARGYGHLPICMAKTQYSFSDDPKLLGAPKDFAITIRQLKLAAGAKFIVALTGEILTMPGLPKRPVAELIDIDDEGKITGLF